MHALSDAFAGHDDVQVEARRWDRQPLFRPANRNERAAEDGYYRVANLDRAAADGTRKGGASRQRLAARNQVRWLPLPCPLAPRPGAPADRTRARLDPQIPVRRRGRQRVAGPTGISRRRAMRPPP